ncbi:MAG: DUF5719 family protein [Beutenbergiaceae bacterium]
MVVPSLLRRAGLVVSGAIVVALTAATVWVADSEPGPTPGTQAIPTYTVTAPTTSWVCAPAPTLPTVTAGSDIDYDPELGTGGGQVATAVELMAWSASSQPQLRFGSVAEQDLVDATTSTFARAAVVDISEPAVGVVSSEAGDVPLVAGLSLARAESGDLRALAVSTCQRPVTSAILVGGSTTLGASSRLILTNPGQTVATVALTGWSGTGPMPQIAPIVVPAGATRTLLLETISLEQRLAIRLDISGGSIAAFLQDSSLDGLVAAGTEMLSVAADPATTITLAPAPLRTDANAVLRLVNPQEDAATVSVDLLGAEGPQPLDGAQDFIIEPGAVVDVSLAGVPDGDYGLRVRGDVPITGAIRLTRAGEPGEADPDTAPLDIAWLTATTPVEHGLLPLPGELIDSAAVAMSNPGEGRVEVNVVAYDQGGSVSSSDTLTVDAGATAAVTVPPEAVLLEFSGGPIVASAVLTADAEDGPLISAISIVDDPYSEQVVTVRVSD